MAKVIEAEVRVTLRLPAHLHAKLTQSASETARSMNGEILARLQESFEGPFTDLSSVGLAALLKRLEATVEASDALFMRQRDAMNELESRMAKTAKPNAGAK